MSGIPFKTKEEYMEEKDAQIAELKAQLQKLTETQASGGQLSMDQLMAFVKELRKPDEETQRKREEELARREQNRQNDLQLALLEESETQRRWANCSHKKENGRSAVVGQIHSDGKVHPLCQHCGYQWPAREPTPEERN